MSPDGRKVISASNDRTLKIWDTESGECLATLIGHEGGIWSCSVSPDGRMVISASDDRTLKVWDTESGECLATLIGHEGEVRSCAVSPDGLRVISAGSDGTVRFWSTETFTQLMPVIQSGRDDWAVIDYQANRVVQCGPEAWRHLAWQALDAEGRINRFPVEIEGPLPIKEF